MANEQDDTPDIICIIDTSGDITNSTHVKEEVFKALAHLQKAQQNAVVDTGVVTTDKRSTAVSNNSSCHAVSIKPTNRSKETADSTVVKHDGRQVCTLCQMQLQSKPMLRRHMAEVHKTTPSNVCYICGKTFRLIEYLKRHLAIHASDKSFWCEICTNKFSSKQSLNEHKLVHSNDRPLQCDICQRRFRQSSAFRRHLSTHSKDRPHMCAQCGQSFSIAGYLKSHMKVHTKEKPYECTVCTKAFAHQSDLNRHKVIHTGSKPYACNQCPASFADPSTRRRHQNEHVSDRPYSCTLCSDAFKRSGQLKAHLKRKHRDAQITISTGSQDVHGYLLELACNEPERNAALENAKKLRSLLSTASKPSNPVDGEQQDEEIIIDNQEHQSSSMQYIFKLRNSGLDTNNLDITNYKHLELVEATDITRGDIRIQPTEQNLLRDAQAVEKPDPTNPNYATNPDFSKEEYYAWLVSYTNTCNNMSVPLSEHAYREVSHVQRAITDFLAHPSCSLQSKRYFQLLMNASKRLSSVIDSHLTYVLEQLE